MKEPLSFALHSIEEFGFSYNLENSLDENGKVLGSLAILFGVNYNWNLETDLIGVAVVTDFTRPDNQLPVMHFKSRINYLVKDLKEYLTIRDPQNDFDMDPVLETTLVSIAISTHRGMVFERTRGTVLHNHHIPLVDPKQHLVTTFLKTVKESGGSATL
ncbi:MAG: hypothetical protein WC865_12070 [Bacteroidales bacterium]